MVPAGATLNLNGLNLYVNDAEISGTIIGGSVTGIPKGGPLTIDTPAPGKLSTAGELDDWTFFDRGGDTVTVTLDPGSGTAGGPVTPDLGWAKVELLDPTGKVLASASSTTAGAILKLTNIALPADGTYTIAVKAAAGHTSSVGNYVVAAYDVTPLVQPLNVNQVITGDLTTPYSTDQWTFSASANTQVKFLLKAESATGLNFSLTGPNGFTGFTNITGSSALVTLPTSGTYTLTAQGTGGATGNFAFEVAQTSQTTLTLGTPYSGTFAGSGQPQLFAVNVPAAAPLSIQLTDPTTKRSRRALRPARHTADATVLRRGGRRLGRVAEPAHPQRRRRHVVHPGLRRVGGRRQHLHPRRECHAAAGDRRDAGAVRDELGGDA